MKNNILIIQPWIRQGGAETLSVFEAYYLNRIGYNVKLLTLFTDFDNLTDKAKKIDYIKPSPFIENLCKKNKFFRIIFGFFILNFLAIKNIRKFEIINPHNQPSHWIAVIAKIFNNKVKIIWTCNEPPKKLTLMESKKIGFHEFLLSHIFDSFIDHFFVDKINQIIVFERKNNEGITRRYHKNSAIINTGIDFDFFSKKPKQIKRILKNKFIIITVGTLVPQKNQKLVIDAVAKLIDDGLNIGLTIVGDGPLRYDLEQLVEKYKIKDYVKFTGKIDNKKLRELYFSSDLNLFLAINQSWGLTPLEALCAKKPSLVSSDCGISGLITEKNMGYITDVNMPDITKKLKFIYNNYIQAKKKAVIGYNFVEKSMSWEKYAKDFSSEVKKVSKI